jgi:hypothetical protein
MEQLYLEQMIVKPMPKKQVIINVKMGDAKKKEEPEKNPRKNVEIVDKRDEMNVNINMVLDRLNKKNLFDVRVLEPPTKSVVIGDEVRIIRKPEKQKQKLVIGEEIKPEESEESEEEEEEEEEDAEKEEEKEEPEPEPEKKEPEKEEEKEPEKGEKKERKKRALKAPKVKRTIDAVMTEEMKNFKMGTHTIEQRLPKPEKIIVKTSSYYMNNRRIFIQKLREMFKDYTKELDSTKESISCSKSNSNSEVGLMTHQKIVRDYLNLYTPYRGLLLYHGLGAGKTAASIAIAEGMKSGKSIVVMTPASLKMNFFSELKKYGDPIYKKNQYWEFISTEGKPEYIDILENVLSIPREVFERNRGAWMVDVTKASNFADLSSSDQESIDEQLNLMIRNKYIDINYNGGITKNKMDELTEHGKVNPFDNKVVIIDEAHNFVSRIVNKIKKPSSLSFKLYDYLMKATNARVVLLTGTPIINYPNEIGILFNILRGSIKTWSFPVTVKSGGKVNKEEILKMFDEEKFKNYDYVDYTDNKVIITRNPFGFVNTKKRGSYKKTGGTNNMATMMTSLFGGKEKEDKQEKKEKRSTKKIKERKNITKKHRNNKEEDEEPFTIEKGIIKINYRPEEVIEDDAKVDVLDRVAPEYHKGGEGEFEKYNGVKLDETGNMSDDDFVKEVKRILKKNKLEVIDGLIEVKHHKALPDDAETFLSMFVDIESGKMKNENTFKKRILGLTSYFRSAQEKLLPSFVKTSDNKNIHVVPVEMSEHQFSSYLKIRKTEIDQEKERRKNAKKQAKKGDDEDIYKISSTYRIFSRAACNFTFPSSIERPLPDKPTSELNENEFDTVPKELLLESNSYVDKEDLDSMDTEPINYKKRIDAALEILAFDPNKPEDEEQFLSKEGLAKYSPKFLKLLENIENEENKGLHLIYSQFRTIEGIGILKLILEANGYAEFKIKKDVSSDKWKIIEKEDAVGKPRFVLYTGTESADEKEIIRNIYNSVWNLVPPEIVDKIKEKSSNNFYGEIIKLFLITSSGAEGINLKNTRFVHIVEPYWHSVRIDQVIGRARRICSHEDLPEELRTVEIFLYLSVFTEKQKTDKNSIEIMIHDISKIDQKSITTDQSLYEIAQIKDNINQKILKSIKETSIDCNVYNTKKSKGKDDEQLICYGSNFGKLESNDFISYPTLEKDMSEKEELNIVQQKIKLKDTKEINGVKYKVDPATNILYDKELFDTNKQLVKVGELKKVGKKILVELNK